VGYPIDRGLLAAGMNVNVWDVSEAIAAIVATRKPVDRLALIDPTMDLASLVK
jgi:3-phenylpropionate/trans-cinnamate dioxygenase ferredoxin reductase subunit